MNAINDDSFQLRQTMVDCQLRTFDITDQAVLARVAELPREIFLPPKQRVLAYSDCAIELDGSAGTRTLLSPMILTRMIEAAEIGTDDRILCVGDPTGYGAAIVAGLSDSIVNLDSDIEKVAQAEKSLAQLGIANIHSAPGPMVEGFPAKAPFDVILVCGASGKTPEALLQQLTASGRLLMIEPIGNGPGGRVVRLDNSATGHSRRALFSASAAVLPGFDAEREFEF